MRAQEGTTVDALLGKIVEVGASGGGLRIKFRPSCVLPQRVSVPEWLKDQTLVLDRPAVPDLREVGGPGDSIVLTVEESAKWLRPLEVEPVVAYGRLPEQIVLTLRWWKDEKAPEFTIRANGKQITGKFEKSGDLWQASMSTSTFFDPKPKLPVSFDISCDKLRAVCSVLPSDAPFWRKILLPEVEVSRIGGPWYHVDVTASLFGGAICALRENGRDVDHFRAPEGFIQSRLENGGHTDRLTLGWQGMFWDQTYKTAMTVSSATREGRATNLRLEGLVDEGRNLRTAVCYTLCDDLPLLVLRRDYHFHPAKKKDDDKQEKPKEPVDEIESIGLAFRSAWRPDSDRLSGSRIIHAGNSGVEVVRIVRPGDRLRGISHKLRDGWVIVEHPLRRECMLYLLDPESCPYLRSWRATHAVTLEPVWPAATVRSGESVGYTMGMVAGELCGAGEGGAWVACRSKMPKGGVRCGVIGRFADPPAAADAVFTLGEEKITQPLEKIMIPGLGQVHFAVADLPEGSVDDSFDACAAGMPARREI
jgi:hypothetical protein